MESDESDVPDLDLPTASVRNKKSKFFAKSRKLGEEVPSSNFCGLSSRCTLTALLTTLVVAVAVLGTVSVRLMARIQDVQLSTQGVVLLPRQVDAIKNEINRLKEEVYSIHLSLMSSGTSMSLSPNGTLFISERLSDIENQVKSISSQFQKLPKGQSPISPDDELIMRIEKLEEQCRRGCEASTESEDEKTGGFIKELNPSVNQGKDRSKKKRSKTFSSHRDQPVIFTRTKESIV